MYNLLHVLNPIRTRKKYYYSHFLSKKARIQFIITRKPNLYIEKPTRTDELVFRYNDLVSRYYEFASLYNEVISRSSYFLISSA